MAKADIDDVCDYIILKHGDGLTHLKLQKLMYYAQAWHLALYREPLFQGKFQAWIHGPVNREIYDRFRDQKSLYGLIHTDDIRQTFDMDDIRVEVTAHLNEILDEYARFTGSELEELTHTEAPWIEARKGFRPSQRCETEIDDNLMAHFYGERAGLTQ